MMTIVFSEHARTQLRRRGISQLTVKKVVYNPEKIIQSYRGRKLRRSRSGSKILEVITRTEGSKTIVVTAYFIKD